MLHDAAKEPVPDTEVINAVVSILESDSPLLNSFLDDGASAIMKPRKKVNGSVKAYDKQIIVGTRQGLGGSLDNMEGSRVHPVMIRTESVQDVPGKDTWTWHEETQSRILTVLANANLTLSTGRVQSPIRRSQRPTEPRIDAASDRIFSTSVFKIATAP